MNLFEYINRLNTSNTLIDHTKGTLLLCLG